MFEKLISQILNKVLGDFIENIDPAQLNISVTSGEVLLTNMKIKNTIFESLPFPFQLAFGQIGKIHLKIPVWNIGSSPLLIEVSDVFAIATPKHIKDWNEQVELKAAKGKNQSMLEQYEVFSQQTEQFKKKDPSSIDKLITKIVDNIQVTIKNIYVRYEDDFSAPNHGNGKFVVGVLLKELSTYTTGDDWKTKIFAEGLDITNKLAKLKNFTVFLDYDLPYPTEEQKQSSTIYKIDYDALYKDKTNNVFKDIIAQEFSDQHSHHQYIIDKFSMESRVQINKTITKNLMPQIDLNTLFGGQFKHLDHGLEAHDVVSVNLNVHQPQIIRILKLLEFIGYYNEFQQGALANFGRKPLGQETADEYVKLYCEWKTICDDKKQAKVADDKRKALQVIEDEYTYDKMIVLRKFATKLLTQQVEDQKLQTENEKKLKEMMDKKIGWGIFISKARKDEEQKQIDEYRKQLEKEYQDKLKHQDAELSNELHEITKDLSSKSALMSEEDFDKMEVGYIRFKLRLSIPSIKFQFFNEFDQVVFLAEIQDQLALIEIGKGVTRLHFELISIGLLDKWTGAAAFPQVLETLDLKELEGAKGGTSAHKSRALVVDIKNNDSAVSPFKFEINTERQLFIVANLQIIKELQRTMLSAFKGEKLDFSFFTEVASQRALQYVYQGKEFIEQVKKGEFQHAALDITLHFTAPIILVPQNIFYPEQPCLIVDSGSIDLLSYLADFQQGHNYFEETTASKMFDRYEIQLKNFQINILEDGLKQGIQSFKRGSGVQIIKKFDASVYFFNCLEPMHELFPTGELSIIIKTFEVAIGLKCIGNLLSIQNSVVDQLDTKEVQIFQQVNAKNIHSLADMVGEGLLNKIRHEQEEIAHEEAKREEDDFFDTINESLDPVKFNEEKERERKYSYQAQKGETYAQVKEESKTQQQTLGTNFKVFFSVEKLQVVLIQESFNQDGEIIHQDAFMNLLLLHFGIEVDIDRKANLGISMSVFKFIIEDTQSEANIALPFRLILSSPLAETTRFTESPQSPDRFGLQFEASVMQRSLVSVIYQEDNEVFRDTFDSEEQKIINEWELQVKIAGSKINVDVNISDLRFVFAVPTAQKLVMVLISLQSTFESSEKTKSNMIRHKLEMYEQVLSQLHTQIGNQSDEHQLNTKVFQNYAKISGLDPSVSAIVFQDSIQKLYLIFDLKKGSDEEVRQVKSEVEEKKENEVKKPEDSSEWKSVLVDQIKKKYTKIAERSAIEESSIDVKAVLKNFSVWIPLQAESDQTQVMQLSFLSEFGFHSKTQSKNTYEVSLNQLIKKEHITTQDEIVFSINNFLIEMLNSKDYFNLLKNFQQTLMNEKNGLYQSVKLINPCKILLNIDNQDQEHDMTKRSNINLTVEPLALKIGYQHIDFFNMIAMQVEGTLKYLEKLQEQSKVLKQDSGKQIDDIEIPRSQVKKMRTIKEKSNAKVQIMNIRLDLEQISLSITDELEDQPLIEAQINNLVIKLKQQVHDDDASTYILKKLGVFEKLYPQYVAEHLFKEISIFSEITVNYFNQRSLFYEPLVEPYFIMLELRQLAPYTVQTIKLHSEKLLNVNLTFAMALTIRKIMDRVQESLKASQALKKMEEKQMVTQDEEYMVKAWRRKMLIQSKGEVQQKVQQSLGFIFQNRTGLQVKAVIHDPTRLGKDDLVLTKPITLSANYQMPEQVFIPLDEIKAQQNDILKKKLTKVESQVIEEEPLQMDFEIQHLGTIEGVPIENLGVYSYRVRVYDTLCPSKGKEGGALKLLKKSQDEFKTTAVIVNIKMDGNRKKISIESNVVIANNISRPLVLYSQELKAKDYYVNENDKINLQPDDVFCVPITWILGAQPRALYLESKARNHQVFKNLEELFASTPSQSKLQQSHSNLIPIQIDYFTTLDITSFKCLPRNVKDGPQQYLVAFNPPLMLSNYNFQSLELRDITKGANTLLALMGPKETGILNQVDGYQNYSDLSWIYYESPQQTLTLTTKGFNLNERLNIQGDQLERFSNNAKVKRDERHVKLNFEIKKYSYINLTKGYGENFELRPRGDFNFVSSVQLSIYPRYMMVNQSVMPLMCDKHTILPLMNDYFSGSKQKVSFKVPGYKQSQNIDISTIGMSGAIGMDLSDPLDVIREKLPQKLYVPQKIEYGLIIQSAPTPFNKTTIVKLVPRFLIVNQLDHPLVIKQKGMKNQVLMMTQQMVYHFENNQNRMIMVRQPSKEELQACGQGKPLYQDLASSESQFWSSPFGLDDLEDFQISYPGQNHLNPLQQTQWYLPWDGNRLMRFARVNVTTQNDATILIVITNPIYPEYEIVNKSRDDIEVAQQQETSVLNGIATLKKALRPDDMIVGKFQKISAKSRTPYVWSDRSYTNRLLLLKIGTVTKEVSIDQVMKKTEVQVSMNKKYNIEVTVDGQAKKIKISSFDQDHENLNQALYLQQLLKRHMNQHLAVDINLKGLGLSFIDDRPQELLFFSVYRLQAGVNTWVEARPDGGVMENMTKLLLNVHHLQLDNMATQTMPVILAPTSRLDKQLVEQKMMRAGNVQRQREESKEGDADNQIEIPFIQAILTIGESHDPSSKQTIRRIRGLQFAIQEFTFQIETSILNTNLKFIIELAEVFSDQEKFKAVTLANSESFERGKQQSRDQVCEALDYRKGMLEGSEDIHANKVFIELIHLGAIKAIVTFKLEKKAVELDISDPSRGFGILNIFYTVFANVASISNSSLGFTELIMTDLFVSQDVLINQITKNYSKQAIMQFYKLLGSSDLIGNPMSFVNKLGTGVYEFVSEPSKGLLKGPDEFVGGIGKGVQSLVTNVVSGGFESIGKITGSLYSVVKNVGGEKNTQIEKPENVVDGVFQGVKGIGSELFSGVTGIISKPIQKTKEEGAKGFVKGFGSGMFGAISSPFTAALRAGTSVAQGVASTATTIGSIGKEQVSVDQSSIYSRFRQPRYINAKNVITSFDEELAQVNTIMQDISKGKYSGQPIKAFSYLPETKANGDILNSDSMASLLVATDKVLLYLRLDNKTGRPPERLFKSKLKKMTSITVSSITTGSYTTYSMSVSCYYMATGMSKFQFQAKEYAKFEKFYTLISVLPQVEAEDKVKNYRKKATKLLDQE